MRSRSPSIPALARRWLKRTLDSAGYELFNKRRYYAGDGLLTTHRPHFQDDALFREAYARGVEAGAGVDPHFEWRIHVALWAAGLAVRVAGDFVECGVNAGFVSSAIMRRLDWNRVGKRFFLIDTFAGPPLDQFSADEVERGRKKLAQEALAAGAYVTDLERVRRNFSEWRNVETVCGRVPEVLSGVPFGAVAFLHLDLNCAYPEREALRFFWERLPAGGVVLLDDYTYFGHDSQTEAIDAVTRSVGAGVLSLPTGQGLIVK